jgi:hypothetical protein
MQRLVPELIQRAAELLGGMDRLAQFLQVEEHALRFWLKDKASAPNEAVVKMVDLILHDDIARAAADRRKLMRDKWPGMPQTPEGRTH